MKTYSENERLQMNQAMYLSLVIGFFMLAIKTYAFFLTGSSAILSDATESVVHVFAVGFATYSMWLSHKPADNDHTYGHDRITFFSAGFEGALITVAAVYILYQTIHKILYGFELQNLDQGMFFLSLATVLNGGLGIYLLRLGKKFGSLVLEADGKHILTDCLTSLGVILALILTELTGWIYFDPMIALLVGLNILWTGWNLIRNAFHGLMDRVDPELDKKIHALLKKETKDKGICFHHLRHRNAGNRIIFEVHFLFPSDITLTKAHELATRIECKIEKSFNRPTELISHLEPYEGHDEVHKRLLGREG